MGRDGRSGAGLAEDEDDEDKTVLNEYALDGSLVVIPDSAKFDALIHAHDGSSLVGAFSLVGDDRRYTFFDAKLHASWNAVIKAFPGDQVTFFFFFFFLVVGRQAPAGGAGGSPPWVRPTPWSTWSAKSARFLTDVYRDLNERRVSKVQAIKYKAADGLEITGYLTLAARQGSQNLPLVVLPHGGPKSRDTLEFDWWSQALASRGYAVLRPNFRGSSGLGWPFVEAGFGEWGKAMQTDLSDGVRYLAKQGADRPQAGLHRRRHLRRLRGPGRGHPGPRGLPLRRLDRRPGRSSSALWPTRTGFTGPATTPPSASGCSTWARTA